MARVCDFDGCDSSAVATFTHPNHGRVDVCETCLDLAPDEAEITRLDSDEEPDSPGAITDY